MSRSNEVPAGFTDPKDNKQIKRLIALLVGAGAIVGGVLLWNSDMVQELINTQEIQEGEFFGNDTGRQIVRVEEKWGTQTIWDGSTSKVYIEYSYDAEGNIVSKKVIDPPNPTTSSSNFTVV